MTRPRPCSNRVERHYAERGVTRAEVWRWLSARGIALPTRGVLPPAAYEGFVKAHPERFPDGAA